MAPRCFRTAARSRGKHPAGLVPTRGKTPTYAVIMGQRFRQSRSSCGNATDIQRVAFQRMQAAHWGRRNGPQLSAITHEGV